MLTNSCSLAESVTKTLLVEKLEDKEGPEVQKDEGKVAVDAAEEPKASHSEQTEAAKEDVGDQPLTSDQSEAPEQPADTVEEPEPQAETQPEALSESSG